MTDRPPYPDRDTGAPRWLRIVGIIALILVLLVGVMLLVGGVLGGHTPPIEHGT